MDLLKRDLNHPCFAVLFSLLLLVTSCSRELADNNQHVATSTATTPDLLEKIELYPDPTCTKEFDQLLLEWSKKKQEFSEYLISNYEVANDHTCIWTRILCRNQMSLEQTRVFYFPKGWQSIECYFPQDNGRYKVIHLGINHSEEVLQIKIPALDTLAFYVKYPSRTKAFVPLLHVMEMSDDQYHKLVSRRDYKFLLLGALLFPFLFFLTQFGVQRDRLNYYYLLFLLGSGTYLLTMLETMPFFELSPKIISEIRLIQLLFLVSTCLTLFGLIKYLHTFLNVSSWSKPLRIAGHVLLGMFLVIVLVPMINPHLFRIENYGSYLQYFRTGALLILLYVLLLIVWAKFKKIRYSNIIMLAFLPLVVSSFYYALSFLVSGGFTWLSLESLILIVGFLVTLLLFGVLLGVRNNDIRTEKIEYQQRALRLQEIDRSKSQFYANMTHEFRTPLTVIKGMAQQIKGHTKIRDLIERNSNRLLTMVNQLLDLAKVETNSLSINWVHGNIVPYLQYLTESCHSLAVNKKISLAFFAKEAYILMDFDEEIIQRILTNLLSNAIKFTPDYGSVKVIASKVILHDKPYFELLIKDTGQGISRDQISHIFDRFYQVDHPGSNSEGNTGLNSHVNEGSGVGLALVKELVQLLTGQIEVESEPGKGSAFLVRLPIVESSTVVARAPNLDTVKFSNSVTDQIDRAGKFGRAVDKPEVLIIEDNQDVTEYIIACLAESYAFQTARNGKIGLQKALACVPDVVLCDVMMPEMDGFEFCQKLKADRRTSHIPIILLTAKATQGDKIMGLSSGANAYLIKPFDKDELLVRLENLTALGQQLRHHLVDPFSPERLSDEQHQQEVAILNEIREVVESNLSNEQFDTLHLCRAMAMSRTQLHRKLKALTGWSTAKYIRSIRLQKAKSLVETTDMPIGEIALIVGYKDFSHFSRSYHKQFGAPPSETRK